MFLILKRCRRSSILILYSLKKYFQHLRDGIEDQFLFYFLFFSYTMNENKNIKIFYFKYLNLNIHYNFQYFIIQYYLVINIINNFLRI